MQHARLDGSVTLRARLGDDLMPTSPLRQPLRCRVDRAGAESGADSVVSVDEMPAQFNLMRAVTTTRR